MPMPDRSNAYWIILRCLRQRHLRRTHVLRSQRLLDAVLQLIRDCRLEVVAAHDAKLNANFGGVLVGLVPTSVKRRQELLPKRVAA